MVKQIEFSTIIFDNSVPLHRLNKILINLSSSNIELNEVQLYQIKNIFFFGGGAGGGGGRGAQNLHLARYALSLRYGPNTKDAFHHICCTVGAA